jgi:DNA (cytosine-5)-methyltransferase 1
MEQAGFTCLFSGEIHPHACKMYEANFGENPYCDLTKLDPTTLPNFDVLCAGFPCQAFSKAGKQLGFNDIRGTLFFDVCRIIECKKPSVVFLENVKNLLKHDYGNTFKTIVNKLEELNYTVSYQVLNAKDFGVPQNRERTIIIATNNTITSISKKKKIFDFKWLDTKSVRHINDILEPNYTGSYLFPDEYTIISNAKKQATSGLIFNGYRNKNMRIKGVLPGTENLSRSHKQPNRIYSAEGTHPTLSSQESSGRYFIYLPTKNQVRKLTMLECFRLMGFPDDFIKIGSISNLYNRLGNSICIPMVYSVSKAIKKNYFT